MNRILLLMINMGESFFHVIIIAKSIDRNGLETGKRVARISVKYK
jgi:hypothetical protein